MLKQFIIRESKNNIILEYGTNNEIINISRFLGYGSIKNKHKSLDVKHKLYRSYGIYGLLKREGKHIISISKVRRVGEIFSHGVYEILGVQIISIVSGDEEILEYIRNMFKGGIYYSKYPIYKRDGSDDSDFLFNKNLLDSFHELVRGDTEPVTVKCICGYFYGVNYETVGFSLISRRSWKYSGTRYFRRGCDLEGNAANYVETEQILYDKDKKSSFIIIRGSIPMRWKQDPEFFKQPKIKFLENENTTEEHLKILMKKYKEIYYINLVKNSAEELEISKKYVSEMERLGINFLYYDFNNEGIINDLKKREEFVKSIEKYIKKFGFTTEENLQNGVFRINCVDSLDRTNFIQYIICREVFLKQLEYLGLSKKLEYMDIDNPISNDYIQTWIQNGNNLSIQYTGTRALKSHKIYNPNRNIYLYILDKFISLKRHYNSLFSDYKIQNGYDLITGNFENLKIRKQKKIPRKSLMILILILSLILIFKQKRKYLVSLYFIFIMILGFFGSNFINFPIYELK